jgi:hypothetical protein
MFKSLWPEDCLLNEFSHLKYESCLPSSSIMCQFLPEKRYQIYPNITDQDEKAEKPGVGQEGTRFRTQGSREKMFVKSGGPPVSITHFPQARFEPSSLADQRSRKPTFPFSSQLAP